MIAYTGIETISNMAEEAKDERTTIPAAIKPRADRGVRHLLHAAGGRAVGAAGRARPGDRRVRDAARRCPRRRAASPATRSSASSSRSTSDRCRSAGELYVGLLAATILFIATNAALIGVSRLVYSMGIHRQVPDALRQLHPRYRTPWIGILVFGAAAIVTLLPGQAEFLGYMYAFGAMLSFTIAHLAVIRLRASQPDAYRPYRGPWQRACARLRPAAVRGLRRPRHVDRVRRHRLPAPGRRGRRLRLADARASRSTSPTGAVRASTWSRRTRSRSRSRSSITRPSTTRCWSRCIDGRYDEHVDGDRDQARRPQAPPRDPRARAR